jgi:hypothetical protein
MLAGLGLTPEFTDHPGTKGDASESRWVEVPREFLPERYGVGPIFAIDSVGGQSDQLDIAIFDQQYSSKGRTRARSICLRVPAAARSRRSLEDLAIIEATAQFIGLAAWTGQLRIVPTVG